MPVEKDLNIEITDAVKRSCPICHTVFAKENSSELLLKQVTLVYFNKNSNKIKVKCNKCKNFIDM